MKHAVLAALFLAVLAIGASATNTTSSNGFSVAYASEVALGETFTLSVADSNNSTLPGLGCAWTLGIAGSSQNFPLSSDWTPGKALLLKSEADYVRFGSQTNYTQTVQCANGDGLNATFSLPLSVFTPEYNNFLTNIPIYLAANPLIVLVSSLVVFILLYWAVLTLGPHLGH